MSHLYVATRSDNPAILKVGRSDDPDRRCASLQSSHCFEVKPLAVWPGAGVHETAVHRALSDLREPGPGREWFRARPSRVYEAVASAMAERERSRSPRREQPSACENVDHLARDLCRRLQPVDRPSLACFRDDIDSLASELYGALWHRVVARAGLVPRRSRIAARDRANCYFYVKEYPECPDPRYVTVARPRGGSSSGDGGRES
jgi:hypothetical protein